MKEIPFKYHVTYWVFIIIALTLFFGRSWENPIGGFFVVTCLFPVVLGWSYLLNFYLIPTFFDKGAYGKFVLYSIYAFILALYIEVWMVLLAFMYLGNFSFEGLAPSILDLVNVTTTLFLLVGLSTAILMIMKLKKTDVVEDIDLQFTSKRKNTTLSSSKIEYIESLNGKVWFHLTEGRSSIETSEKLSSLMEKLPGHFLRMHRSFIVNSNEVLTYNQEGVVLKSGEQLSWGRAYKKEALDYISSPNSGFSGS
ncbi:MAG: LytR/AlgR family response regulator transcription factor [Flavobacteriaceae bacterium]